MTRFARSNSQSQAAMSQSEDRHRILSALQRHCHSAPRVDHPGVDSGNWTRYDDVEAQFVESIGGVGGQVHWSRDLADLGRQVQQLDGYQSGHQRSCVVADVTGDWSVDLQQIEDPHDLDSLDFGLFPGSFAVAENAAVWVTDRTIPQRAALFIAQHVALAIPRDEIVHNMHEAYQRLDFSESHFGCFISGPSKTADIEQSLVIGAHGARSLDVFLVETGLR